MKHSNIPNPEQAVLIQIDENAQDQRLDNFLLKVCKGVPKSHIFRIIRSGEVRVDKKRAEVSTKLQMGQWVRVPPIRVSPKSGEEGGISPSTVPSKIAEKLAQSIEMIYEDDDLLVVNKPSGMAVHGGSGHSLGLIETLRQSRSHTHQSLELVHRIDRETSGVLVVSKKRSALRALQEQLRARSWKKHYQTLVFGDWPAKLKTVDLPLLKTQASEKEARVFVDPKGDKATSLFKVVQRFARATETFTLLEVQILTGRTHQIRVHTSANSHPIVGDDRYGLFEQNKMWAKQGLRRMFLHAAKLQLVHPRTQESLVFEAPMPPELLSFLKTLSPKA